MGSCEHSAVPWSAEQSERLVEVWRALLESQNGEWVDGSELQADGGAIGWALDSFVPAGERVLILGAGRGQEVATARSRGYVTQGFTLGPKNIEVARRQFGVALEFQDAHCSLLPDRSFGAVLGLQILEHSPAPLMLLLECARVLRPGGLLITETPAPTRHTGGRSLHHVLCPTPRQLVGLFEKAGFVHVRQWSERTPLALADLDRSDLPDDLLTVGVRARDDELEGFDPITRQLLASHSPRPQHET